MSSPPLVDFVTIPRSKMHARGDMPGAAVSLPPPPDEPRPLVETLAFDRLYEEHFALVWRALRRYGVEGAELDDALQEVFLVVHAKLASFEGRSSVRTWIYGIARRVARDHRTEARLEVRDPGMLDELPATREGVTSEQRDQTRLLYALLDELEPARREVVVLVELEQMTVAEAAEILGENPNTLQSRLRLARGDLAQAWERQCARDTWRSQCATTKR